ncbi:thioredoxin family protein [candidate division KSB1 bacterium]
MKRQTPLSLMTAVLLSGIFACITSISVSAQTPTSQGVSKINWVGFDDGLAKAGQEKKLILLDIYTDWCTWCKEMDNTVYTNNQVVDYINEHYVAVKLNAESDNRIHYMDNNLTQRELSYAMQVVSYPTTVFLKADGKPIIRLPGYVPPETFRDIIEFINMGDYNKMSFEEWQKSKIKQ